MPNNKAWTNKEVALLREYWPLEGPAQLVRRFPGRSKNSIIGKAHGLFLGPSVVKPGFSFSPRRIVSSEPPSPPSPPRAVPPHKTVGTKSDITTRANIRVSSGYLFDKPIQERELLREAVTRPVVRKPTKIASELVRRPERVVLGGNVNEFYMNDPPPGRSALDELRKRYG